MRSGKFVKQASEYVAFIPAELPPQPPIEINDTLMRLLSDADRCLGRLDGITEVLPNPNLFVAMYVRHEAVLSSQIEGTQSTLEDILQYEVEKSGGDLPKDIEEVVNYVKAMNYGIERLETLPLSLRLIREIHEILLSDVRGAERSPGEFRRSQNWIGTSNSNLKTATYVPPPIPEMNQALSNLEKFLHDESLPVLILCGLAHAQFETIHPFLDGNGRVGRLLITFLLCQRRILQKPLLYLSYYLKANRAEYYDRLMAVRTDGNWEGWLRFFLRGVLEVSQSATNTAREILQMRENHRELINSNLGAGANNGLKLLELLYQNPLINVRFVEEKLECSFATANKLVEKFVQLELLKENTGQKRNRFYLYQPYYNIFDKPMITTDDSTNPLITNSEILT